MKPLELWIEKTYQGHGDAFGIARTSPFPNHIHVKEVTIKNEELCETWFESYDNLEAKLEIAVRALKILSDHHYNDVDADIIRSALLKIKGEKEE